MRQVGGSWQAGSPTGWPLIFTVSVPGVGIANCGSAGFAGSEAGQDPVFDRARLRARHTFSSMLWPRIMLSCDIAAYCCKRSSISKRETKQKSPNKRNKPALTLVVLDELGHIVGNRVPRRSGSIGCRTGSLGRRGRGSCCSLVGCSREGLLERGTHCAAARGDGASRLRSVRSQGVRGVARLGACSVFPGSGAFSCEFLRSWSEAPGSPRRAPEAPSAYSSRWKLAHCWYHEVVWEKEEEWRFNSSTQRPS